jgi:hypothetical protein
MRELAIALLAACGGGSTPQDSHDAPAPCTTVDDCLAPRECNDVACNAGSCVVTPKPMDTYPSDDSVCKTVTCIHGQAVPGFVAAGTACETSNKCDGAGACVQCLSEHDCASFLCRSDHVCACALAKFLISEVRPRGTGGNTDEFVEIYNPAEAPETFTKDWTITSRSDLGPYYSLKYTGANEVVPAHGHLLIVGDAYSNTSVPRDGLLAAGITDNASVLLYNGASVVDAVCFYGGVSPFDGTYTCEGTPLPGANTTSDVDQSYERKGGSDLGNCQDTNDSTSDWQQIAPANPQNLASAAAP